MRICSIRNPFGSQSFYVMKIFRKALLLYVLKKNTKTKKNDPATLFFSLLQNARRITLLLRVAVCCLCCYYLQEAVGKHVFVCAYLLLQIKKLFPLGSILVLTQARLSPNMLLIKKLRNKTEQLFLTKQSVIMGIHSKNAHINSLE